VIGNTLANVEDLGILEGIQGSTISDLLAGQPDDLANYSVTNAFGDSYRCVYFYPDQISVLASGSTITVDGFFMAAAAAGYFSGSTKINEPLTLKTLSGFTIAQSKVYPPLVTRNVVNSGICMLTPVAGGGEVIWGLTTTASGQPTEQEISVVFIRDAIASDTRAGMKPYIGHAESSTTKATLFAAAQGIMKTFIQRNLIVSYAGLSVQQDAVETRQWNVAVAVKPVQSTNWIWVLFSVS
jgi:hypothetical protein